MIGVPQKRGSSRTRMARPAARVAPAEHPPRMIPFSLGDIARDSALAMAYRCGLIQRGLVGTLPEEVENHRKQTYSRRSASSLEAQWKGFA